ncbi:MULTISPECIES: DUF3093 domain-containing protein [unclassified Frondihabitans]|jgi:hypothetical protein|uniref:DUF3093 domain-containing protein n=1 Tax=unclassified Frondihabitans TaxID=2626248 RepID=UPI000701B7CE|nr:MULTISPECIES: DUF3093 domain-containing protein [unclassified Frondihabitans]KQQ27556.1 hypothetical protein ASF54_01835 [Frondihabitans sp. Leaf304]RPE75164.1 DUF3093 family protein [Frondihabitans sp. PhB153]RPF04406.1 DUF3093 family protein [Frondihabitans sp. PhB161]
MTSYRERLSPPPQVFVALLLVVPASVLVFLPINVPVGWGVGIALFVGFGLALWFGSPVLTVAEEGFRAGRAILYPGEIGAAAAFSGEEATAERGVRLDARAWTLFRGWVKPVIKIGLTDPSDPAPYWLVSTRHPERLSLAIDAIRPRTPGR